MSSVFQHGTPINIIERVFLIDPISEEPELTNAAAATFTVEDPDGTETVYAFGVATEVTNPQTGIYVLALAAPADPGHYRYEFDSDNPDAHSEGAFDVLEQGIAPFEPTLSTPGPCTTWIDGDDVADCAGATLGVGSSTYLLDDAAAMASALLFEISGRLFPGTCERTVRPCRTGCSCFSSSLANGLFWDDPVARWKDGCGDTCGCGSVSSVKLPGYPIRSIVEVKIDGEVIAADGYRLDERRYLLRLDDPETGLARSWPACQNLGVAEDAEGSFTVRYLYGIDPPVLGREAAKQLAVELYRACPGVSAGDCALPTKVTKIVRSGLTIERLVPLSALLQEGASGLQLVDAFIATYNPKGIRRRPAVWSPDVPRMARRA